MELCTFGVSVYPDSYLLAINTDRDRPKCSKTVSAPKTKAKTKTKSSNKVERAEPLDDEEPPFPSDNEQLTVNDDPPTLPALSVEPVTLEKQRQDQFFADIIDFVGADVY